MAKFSMLHPAGVSMVRSEYQNGLIQKVIFFKKIINALSQAVCIKNISVIHGFDIIQKVICGFDLPGFNFPKILGSGEEGNVFRLRKYPEFFGRKIGSMRRMKVDVNKLGLIFGGV